MHTGLFSQLLASRNFIRCLFVGVVTGAHALVGLEADAYDVRTQRIHLLEIGAQLPGTQCGADLATLRSFCQPFLETSAARAKSSACGSAPLLNDSAGLQKTKNAVAQFQSRRWNAASEASHPMNSDNLKFACPSLDSNGLAAKKEGAVESLTISGKPVELANSEFKTTGAPPEFYIRTRDHGKVEFTYRAADNPGMTQLDISDNLVIWLTPRQKKALLNETSQ